MNAIVITEGNVDISASSPLAWTGTKSDGTKGIYGGSQGCDDWTASNGVASGQLGVATATDATWTETSTLRTCNESHHLYCFEQ